MRISTITERCGRMRCWRCWWGRPTPRGSQRVRARDRGAALASASTLNRLELGRPEAAPASRYHRIVADPQALDALLVDLFVEAHAAPPAELWLDLDATDDPLHGQQEGRFFHGYYRHYCYLPLYIFCDEHLLGARLRPANQDAAAGSVAELERIVAHLRRRWPATRIGIRGDGGFCREAILAWCERHGVAYVLGLARNARLAAALEPALQEAAAEHRATGQPARRFRDLRYRTLTSWSRTRRVVGKAEVLARGRNPRFVVTSLTPDEADARELYEDRYCIRGSMENRIKEQQLDLFADRTSAHTMRANQLRLYFSSFALRPPARAAPPRHRRHRPRARPVRHPAPPGCSRSAPGSGSPPDGCGWRSRKRTREPTPSPGCSPTCSANPCGARPERPPDTPPRPSRAIGAAPRGWRVAQAGKTGHPTAPGRPIRDRQRRHPPVTGPAATHAAGRRLAPWQFRTQPDLVPKSVTDPG